MLPKTAKPQTFFKPAHHLFGVTVFQIARFCLLSMPESKPVLYALKNVKKTNAKEKSHKSN